MARYLTLDQLQYFKKFLKIYNTPEQQLRMSMPIANSAKATILQALFEGMLRISTFLLRSKRMVHTVSLQHHFKVVGSKYCGPKMNASNQLIISNYEH